MKRTLGRFRNKTTARRSPLFFCALLTLLGMVVPSGVWAASLDTVNWVNPNPIAAENAGTGSGTLNGGSITVGYSTVSGGLGNAATTNPANFTTSLATAGAVPLGVTNGTGGVLGTVPGAGGATPNTVTQTITFSSTVSNPVLLLDFSDANTSLNFGTASLTTLSSNNAQVNGDIVSFIGSSNGGNDGIALRINGTFGPGSNLSFGYTEITPSVSNFDSVLFTVGILDAAVPEPASIVMASTAAVVGLGFAWRRRRKPSA